MSFIAIDDREFLQFQRFIYDRAGITLSSTKKALVSGRLAKRVRQLQLDSYADYLELLASGQAQAEVQTAIDLLTTNETYFFRESKHFEFLRELCQARAPNSEPMRVWSAACSTGEEPYSIAMVLADLMSRERWEVLSTDISSRVLERARVGHYPMERARDIPADYLKRFCLKGIKGQEGTLLVERALRQRVQFMHANLNEQLPQIGMFDVVFLRNVMIYFSGDTKRQVVSRVVSQLKRGGHLFIGHSESLHDINSDVQQIRPAVYRKP
ncbi:protein-glutamate O-methyltransferase [Schlegelella sp. S2-27]|uniref:Chemotaxis protein methyltransferase n=1 Tax=Caldimonas mangrovi TaxID=2944811 RepID=A0ABT0YRA7_9BURK|nr:protein-glutamate O-methyltransferase [Caldimonas mangrovi]MCM5681264.1 protein-glutamate O-methyltransferase [Caldimonas mangrovi]